MGMCGRYSFAGWQDASLMAMISAGFLAAADAADNIALGWHPCKS
jgi:hypothetical protein